MSSIISRITKPPSFNSSIQQEAVKLILDLFKLNFRCYLCFQGKATFDLWPLTLTFKVTISIVSSVKIICLVICYLHAKFGAFVYQVNIGPKIVLKWPDYYARRSALNIDKKFNFCLVWPQKFSPHASSIMNLLFTNSTWSFRCVFFSHRFFMASCR